MSTNAHGSWRLTYQRAGWVHPAWRYFNHADTLERYIDKLLDGGRPDLEPLVLLKVDTRAVGPWTTEQTLIGGEGWA